ncbi:MAG: putative membrane protein YccC [Bradymonadia bacterium]|jgi:uncharacterized membrane protein YccC
MMPRLYLSLIIAFVAFLAGCGLSDRERAVAHVNENIRTVEASGQAVAEVIAQLPERELTREDFDDLRGSLGVYLIGMDALNAAMRSLGEHVQELREHVEDTFRPSAEAAAGSCQAAIDAIDSEEASQEDYQRAITRIGQCLERYATAVSNVKAAHDRANL